MELGKDAGFSDQWDFYETLPGTNGSLIVKITMDDRGTFHTVEPDGTERLWATFDEAKRHLTGSTDEDSATIG